MFPGRQRAFDNPSFHKLGVVFEAGVQVLIGADKFRDHNFSLLISCRGRGWRIQTTHRERCAVDHGRRI
jgi:hypothetical protein